MSLSNCVVQQLGLAEAERFLIGNETKFIASATGALGVVTKGEICAIMLYSYSNDHCAEWEISLFFTIDAINFYQLCKLAFNYFINLKSANNVICGTSVLEAEVLRFLGFSQLADSIYLWDSTIDGVIYKITNLITGNIYIGQSRYNNLKRWQDHCSPYDKTHIGCAIRKYGKDNFSYEVIDHADSFYELNQKEITYISELHPYYNHKEGGCHYYIASQTDEHRRKISASNKEYYADPEVRRRHSERMKQTWTPERRAKQSEISKEIMSRPGVRENLSEKTKGHTLSEDTKRKIVEARHRKGFTEEQSAAQSVRMKELWSTSEYRGKMLEIARNRAADPVYRRKLSDALQQEGVQTILHGRWTEEEKKRFGETQKASIAERREKGIFMPKEERQRRSDAQRGKKQSPETIAKRAEKLRGQKRSPEFCEKMSKKNKERYAAHPEISQQISSTLQGHFVSEETRAKIAAANTGKKQSEEVRKKRSEAMKKVWANKRSCTDNKDDN